MSCLKNRKNVPHEHGITVSYLYPFLCCFMENRKTGRVVISNPIQHAISEKLVDVK